MSAVKGNIALGYFTTETQRFAESHRLQFNSAQGVELISCDGYPPRAACAELAEVEVPEGRRWRAPSIHHRGHREHRGY